MFTVFFNFKNTFRKLFFIFLLQRLWYLKRLENWQKLWSCCTKLFQNLSQFKHFRFKNTFIKTSRHADLTILSLTTRTQPLQKDVDRSPVRLWRHTTMCHCQYYRWLFTTDSDGRTPLTTAADLSEVKVEQEAVLVPTLYLKPEDGRLEFGNSISDANFLIVFKRLTLL